MALRVPHTLVLLFAIMMFALVLTWVLPAGSFDTEVTDAGEVVVPGTFQVVEDPPVLAPWSLLTAVPRAMADAQAVIFFVFLIGGVIAVVRSTGAIDAMIGGLLERFGDRIGLLIFGSMFTFGVFSATFGMSAEYIAFVGILIALASALRLDTIVAIALLVIGYGVGYGCALFNPFTVLVAQEVAGLQPGSGWWYRAIIAVPMFLIAFHHVYRYAMRVHADPSASLVADVPAAQAPEPEAYPGMTNRRRLVLISGLVTLIALVLGITVADWYLVELAALFLALAIAATLIGGLRLDDAANTFIAGAAQMTGTALLIGFARSIALIMEDGQVLHTVVNGLAAPLSLFPPEISAVGMLLLQSLLNFFIPSGSGQAFATMPLMAPIGDLVNVSRQTAVLAYQFGDGFTNMIIPTNAVLMGILGLAGVPYTRWVRFIGPLLLKLTAAAAVAMVVAVWIGYS